MLKQRLIASLVLKNGMVVQSIGFHRYLPVGTLGVCVENLNRFGVDEIVIVDIDASREKRFIDTHLIEEATKSSFVPITVAGGIESTEQIALLLRSGADKIMIHQAFWQTPHLVHNAAEIFGSQCVIVSLDAYEGNCYDYKTKTVRNETLLSAAKRAADLGAGEILLNDVKRDGMKTGLDIKTITSLVQNLPIPLIAQGGVGHVKHIQEGLEIEGLCAVAVGNFFHFTEHSVTVAKGYMKAQKNYPIRNETYANYKEHSFDQDGRVGKIDDDRLAHMWFEHHPQEII